MTVDEARENLSTANTRLGAAWRDLKYAEKHGSTFDVLKADEKWEAAEKARKAAELALLRVELADT